MKKYLLLLSVALNCSGASVDLLSSNQVMALINNSGYIGTNQAVAIAQAVMAGWDVEGTVTNTYTASGMGAYISTDYTNTMFKFVSDTSPAPTSAANSFMLVSNSAPANYGIIVIDGIPTNASANPRCYITFQGPTNYGGVNLLLLSEFLFGTETWVGGAYDAYNGLVSLSSNTVQTLGFNLNITNEVLSRRLVLWVAGYDSGGGLNGPTNTFWINNVKIVYDQVSTKPTIAATLFSGLEINNNSNLLVVCEGDSLSETGISWASHNWPYWFRDMMFATNRCILFTNFAVSGSRLDGNTNWFHGDAGNLAALLDVTNVPNFYPGVIQRYSRLVHPLATTYASAEKWYLLRGPSNDGAVADITWATSLTNLYNSAKADGFNVVWINEAPRYDWTYAARKSRNSYVVQNWGLWDYYIDLASIYSEAYTNKPNIWTSDGVHPYTATVSPIEASYINAQLFNRVKTPFMQWPAWR